MALEVKLETRGVTPSPIEEGRIRRRLQSLERRLVHRPEPTATLVLSGHAARRQVDVDLRVKLGPLGPHLVSHQAAETADHAVRLAVQDIERQLERVVATQRGEPSFGVPSRRLPEALRPNPPGRSREAEQGSRANLEADEPAELDLADVPED